MTFVYAWKSSLLLNSGNIGNLHWKKTRMCYKVSLTGVSGNKGTSMVKFFREQGNQRNINLETREQSFVSDILY